MSLVYNLDCLSVQVYLPPSIAMLLSLQFFVVAATLIVVVSHQNLFTLIFKSRGNVVSNATILISSMSTLAVSPRFLLL